MEAGDNMARWDRKAKRRQKTEQPGFDTTLVELAKMLENEEYESALKKGAEILQAGCRLPEFLFMMAQCFFFTGDYMRAEEWLGNTLQFAPHHARAKLFLGRLYLMQGKREKARKIWQTILNTDNELSAQEKSEIEDVLLLCQPHIPTKEEQEEWEASHTQHIAVWQLLQEKGAEEFLAEKNRLQNITLRRLRRQKQIKLAFVLYDSSMWCGDALYHYFAHDARYKTVVYLCKRHDAGSNDPATIRAFHQQTREMQGRGIKVVPILDEVDDSEFETPDILIALTPYDTALPQKLVFAWMSFATLLVYIPYGIFVWDSRDNGERTYNMPMVNMAWKMFIDSEGNRDYYARHLPTGFPNGEASGSPRCDVLYKDQCGDDFTWKAVVPESKHIVYAPHWSVNAGCKFSTFQYNYDFFYNYACRHQDISWVIKPHPNLFHEAVRSGVFASEDEVVAYFNRWDSLPNAKVVSGGNYQSIFASSDAMILDSASFIMEYQYTEKPLLFLTRLEQAFLPLGLQTIRENYYVDGRDFYGIAAFISQVVLGGQDRKRERRSLFFEKNLDYKRKNGMFASEYIYHSIDKEIHMQGGEEH